MEFNENKPIYLQLADMIMDQIQSGDDLSGQRLLSVREYAARTGVNANTVMRTYTWLQQEGIIYNQRGIGYFYDEDARARVLAMRKKLFYDKEMEYFMNRLMTFEISPDEFYKIYSEYLEQRDV